MPITELGVRACAFRPVADRDRSQAYITPAEHDDHHDMYSNARACAPDVPGVAQGEDDIRGGERLPG